MLLDHKMSVKSGFVMLCTDWLNLRTFSGPGGILGIFYGSLFFLLMDSLQH